MATPTRLAATAQLSETPQIPSRGFYQCGVCKKEYGRADHLIRHVRSHTSDKPFKCDRCGKGFTRIDLLRRHAQGHNSTQDNGPYDSTGVKGRVSQACKSCAASKLKCDDRKPCRRCVRRNQTCQWPQRDNIHYAPALEQAIWPADQSVAQPGFSPLARELKPTNQHDEANLGNPGPEDLSEDLVMDNANDGTSVSPLQCEGFNQEMAGLNAFPLTGYEQWNAFGVNNLDFGLTDEDLEFLDYLNRPGPPQGSHVIQEQPAQQFVPTDTESPNNDDEDSLDESPLSHWTPRAEDNAYMDQQYLSVPEHLDTPVLTGVPRPRIFAEALTRESRDAAFALVVSKCQRKGLNRIMQCFPSAELLDSLIQIFFAQQKSEIDTWIHESTMQLNNESPEMILTLAAAGAVLTDLEAIQRLGYAMLEIARLQVNDKYEDNNTLTRQLKQQQEYVLILQIGLWSGDKRRVEIAESFAQPVVTMLRRAARFKCESYPMIAPTMTDDEATLDRKWRQWVDQESLKRLAHHIFIHDVQASVLRSTNPLMSHIELDLSIPFSRKLWDAKTAAQWKSIYLQEVPKTMSAIPSLATTLQDISDLSRFPHHGDFRLAALATDCNQIRRSPSGQWSTLAMKLWQQELQQALEKFEIVAVEPLQQSIPAIPLIYQTVSLSLYLPLGILETFTGKDGEARSVDIYQSYIRHISPENLRKASWHAGQVLRIARSMPPGSLTAFCATCLYFAALALWSLSTMFSLNRSISNTRVNNEDPVFLLDGNADNATLRRFTLSGQGDPALSSPGKYVPLGDRAAVMGLFQQLLRSKHGGVTSNQQSKALDRAFCILGKKYFHGQ
ncbi:C6 and C2H2 transcription factor [Penicillium lividum]|nr:C6 and C2H2 transcription factor [Penicillium lividum]